MLKAEDLTFAWPGQKTPYRFTFEVQPGKIAAVSGVSGSGKSTLLDLVAGFQSPTSGALTLDGKNLLSLPPESRPVSILFQSDNLFDHLTAADNIALAIPQAQATERRERVAEALAQMGLAEFARSRAADLSGGQKQRVALARTLLRNRPILLLDEPFTGLDAETAATIRDLVRRLAHDNGWHTLLVSHDRDDIAALADHAYLLSEWHLIPRT